MANYEVLTDYLAKTQGIGRYAIDQASTGQTDDVAEYMRDLTARIGAPISLANSLKNAPEEVKRAYRVMKTRWDKASITGSGETFDAVKDYASDVVFSPEGLATLKYGLRALAKLPHCHIKLCGFGMFDQAWTGKSIAPIFKFILDFFGPERMLFGSNYPVDKLMRTYDFIIYELLNCCKENGLTEEEQERIFSKNARDFYRLQR